MSKKVVRILSIDGGGIRGIIPAKILAEIEKRTAQIEIQAAENENRDPDVRQDENGEFIPTSELFDMIVGTSTGGILALGLNKKVDGDKPKYSAADLAGIYKNRGHEIFNRDERVASSRLESLVSSVENAVPLIETFLGMEAIRTTETGSSLATVMPHVRGSLAHVKGLSDEKYPQTGLKRVLKGCLGDATLGCAITKTMVTTYDMQSRKPLFLKSWCQDHKTVKMKDAALATSAAPTFFEPVQLTIGQKTRTLIDGGVFVNTPAVSAYAEAKRMIAECEEFKHLEDSDIFVLSLGTGESTQKLKHEEAKDWGKLEWLPKLLGCMFDGMSDAADYQMRRLLGENYIRLQGKLKPKNEAMDDASEKNIKDLEKLAQEMITLPYNDSEERTVIDEICDRLVEAPPNNLV